LRNLRDIAQGTAEILLCGQELQHSLHFLEIDHVSSDLAKNVVPQISEIGLTCHGANVHEDRPLVGGRKPASKRSVSIVRLECGSPRAYISRRPSRLKKSRMMQKFLDYYSAALLHLLEIFLSSEVVPAVR
jgi:hypothetical protein